MYESETTRFLREFLEKNPEVVQDQKKGRAIWWDKQLNAAEQDAFRDARVPQAGYVYQNKG